MGWRGEGTIHAYIHTYIYTYTYKPCYAAHGIERAQEGVTFRRTTLALWMSMCISPTNQLQGRRGAASSVVWSGSAGVRHGGRSWVGPASSASLVSSRLTVWSCFDSKVRFSANSWFSDLLSRLCLFGDGEISETFSETLFPRAAGHETVDMLEKSRLVDSVSF